MTARLSRLNGENKPLQSVEILTSIDDHRIQGGEKVFFRYHDFSPSGILIAHVAESGLIFKVSRILTDLLNDQSA